MRWPVIVLVLQTVITLALLVFAFFTRLEDPTISNVVVSAAIYHWLRESIIGGRDIKRAGNHAP